MTNIGVNILGYKNPEITKAIINQLDAIPSTHQTFYSPHRAEFLSELASILPPQLNKVIFTNSGTESVEAALKLASAASGKHTFIAATDSYHGRTLGSLSVTGQQKYREPFLSLLNKAVHVPFNEVEALEIAITDEIAAVILEPILGEAGVILPDLDYLKRVKELCESKGILLILDEVQSAIRTGSWFAFEKSGIIPDIICLSKSFSYGIPFGLVITTEKVSSLMPKSGHGSTFAGNPMSCTAALETIKQIKKERLLSNATEMGNYFLKELKKIHHAEILKIKGKGLMIGIEVNGNSTPYLRKMQDMGLIAGSSSSNTIKFLPPINVNKSEIDEAISIIKKVFS